MAGKYIEHAFQKYKIFKKWRSDAHSMAPRVQKLDLTLTRKKHSQTEKLEKITNIMRSASELSFRHLFVFEKMTPYAQDRAKKPNPP